jgi:cytochrome oxidase Cu insertion factor (SCO1/SenC/PrrC family)
VASIFESVPFPHAIARARSPTVTPSGAPAISHSGYFLLVDENGHVRGAYDSSDVKRLDELIRDARYLARTGHRGALRRTEVH